MKIRIWGARGSTPSPILPEEIREKLVDVIHGMPPLDSADRNAVRAYVDGLPPLLAGTAGGNTTCVEITVGSEIIIIDAGTGIQELGRALMSGPCGRGEGRIHLIFSHAHWDHVQGFPFFMPAFIPGNRITLYSVHDLNLALTEQQRYLCFPVAINPARGEQELDALEETMRLRYPYLPAMQADMEFVRLEAGKPFRVGSVQINTIRNHHPGDAYGYRFEDPHSVFVYGGDAEYKKLDEQTFQERIPFFKDADALLFDAQYSLHDSWEDKAGFGHSSAGVGVELARRAGVKRLLLTHHEPTASDLELQEVQRNAAANQAQDPTLPVCEVIMAYEGLELDLAPPGAGR